jgi:hypothetical protein
MVMRLTQIDLLFLVSGKQIDLILETQDLPLHHTHDLGRAAQLVAGVVSAAPDGVGRAEITSRISVSLFSTRSIQPTMSLRSLSRPVSSRASAAMMRVM